MQNLVEAAQSEAIQGFVGLHTGDSVQTEYEAAKAVFERVGINTELVMEAMGEMDLSMPIWPFDKVRGYEPESTSTGAAAGIQEAVSEPGMPRTLEEHRADLEEGFSHIPGLTSLLLHQNYADTGDTTVHRSEQRPEHYSSWLAWGQTKNHKLHHNATLFGHDEVDQFGLTLSSSDEGIRKANVAIVKNARMIADYLGRLQGKKNVHNLWMADGVGEDPIDTATPRRQLWKSAEEMFDDAYNAMVDAIESKDFGLHLEWNTVASHQVCSDIALMYKQLLTFDSGHFNEISVKTLADQLEAALTCPDRPGVLLHAAQPVGWDSDHSLRRNERLASLAQAIYRSGSPEKAYFAADFFQHDADPLLSFVNSGRAAKYSVLKAMLEPFSLLKQVRTEGRDDMVVQSANEQAKLLPYDAVWREYCRRSKVAIGEADAVSTLGDYRAQTLANRN